MDLLYRNKVNLKNSFRVKLHDLYLSALNTEFNAANLQSLCFSPSSELVGAMALTLPSEQLEDILYNLTGLFEENMTNLKNQTLLSDNWANTVLFLLTVRKLEETSCKRFKGALFVLVTEIIIALILDHDQPVDRLCIKVNDRLQDLEKTYDVRTSQNMDCLLAGLVQLKYMAVHLLFFDESKCMKDVLAVARKMNKNCADIQERFVHINCASYAGQEIMPNIEEEVAAEGDSKLKNKKAMKIDQGLCEHLTVKANNSGGISYQEEEKSLQMKRVFEGDESTDSVESVISYNQGLSETEEKNRIKRQPGFETIGLKQSLKHGLQGIRPVPSLHIFSKIQQEQSGMASSDQSTFHQSDCRKGLHWTVADFRPSHFDRHRQVRPPSPPHAEVVTSARGLRPRMQQRPFRIASMIHWRKSLPFKVVEIADAGLYYDEDNDQICCCKCSWTMPKKEFAVIRDLTSVHVCPSLADSTPPAREEQASGDEDNAAEQCEPPDEGQITVQRGTGEVGKIDSVVKTPPAEMDKKLLEEATHSSSTRCTSTASTGNDSTRLGSTSSQRHPCPESSLQELPSNDTARSAGFAQDTESVQGEVERTDLHHDRLISWENYDNMIQGAAHSAPDLPVCDWSSKLCPLSRSCDDLVTGCSEYSDKCDETSSFSTEDGSTPETGGMSREDCDVIQESVHLTSDLPPPVRDLPSKLCPLSHSCNDLVPDCTEYSDNGDETSSFSAEVGSTPEIVEQVQSASDTSASGATASEPVHSNSTQTTTVECASSPTKTENVHNSAASETKSEEHSTNRSEPESANITSHLSPETQSSGEGTTSEEECENMSCILQGGISEPAAFHQRT